MLKKNEQAFLELSGSSLIEPRKLPGHWEGRSKGVSIRIAKGVSYRVGSSRGHYVQGDEVPTPIDTGTLTITDQRVVFQGPKATREWAFSKLLGLQHADSPNAPWTALQVANRQKTSGFMYSPSVLPLVRFRLELALAHFNEEVDELIGGLERRLTAHRANPPDDIPERAALSAQAALPAPARLPAEAARPTNQVPQEGWFPDPAGRHQYRYLGTSGWTEHVADAGVPTVDPLG